MLYWRGSKYQGEMENPLLNFNKTFGNFAAGESEDFMVLNRNYERGSENGIANGSAYINPQEHIDIFADTEIDSQKIS